jgi:hypothetical protein
MFHKTKLKAYSADDQSQKVKYYLTYETSFDMRNRIVEKEQDLLYDQFCTMYQQLQNVIHQDGILLDSHIVEYDKLMNLVERYKTIQFEKEERKKILETLFT